MVAFFEKYALGRAGMGTDSVIHCSFFQNLLDFIFTISSVRRRLFAFHWIISQLEVYVSLHYLDIVVGLDLH